MSHAEICPVCKGEGNLPGPCAPEGPEYLRPCHGCNGKGWVEIGSYHEYYDPPKQYPGWFEYFTGRVTWTCGGDVAAK